MVQGLSNLLNSFHTRSRSLLTITFHVRLENPFNAFTMEKAHFKQLLNPGAAIHIRKKLREVLHAARQTPCQTEHVAILVHKIAKHIFFLLHQLYSVNSLPWLEVSGEAGHRPSLPDFSRRKIGNFSSEASRKTE